MEVNFPESYVEMTLTGINTTRFWSRQVNQDLILEHNFTDLVPGTTYEITLEPRFEDLWGDPVELKITSRLGELTFECFEIFKNETSDGLNSNSAAEQSEIFEQNYENDLAKYSKVKCRVSIDGRFDNITFTSEPPFMAEFQVFTSNYLEYELTKLTPGETYRYSANIEAGPWIERSFQEVPTIPSRPVLFLFKVYIDNSIEIRLLLNGKGVSFTYQFVENNAVVETRVEAFKKYKFLLTDPKFYGMTLRAFVSTKELESERAAVILKEVNFFNVVSSTVQVDTDFYLSINYTVNSLDFDHILMKIQPDPNPVLKKVSRPSSKTVVFLLHPFFCGNNTMLSMIPYADYTAVGPEFETELSPEPCPIFSHIEHTISLLLYDYKAELSLTIPFKGEIVYTELLFVEREGSVANFTVTGKWTTCPYGLIYS